MRNFRNYDFYIDAIQLTSDIYKLTKQFPNSERFGLCDQIQRASVSIASNIAEGASRTSEVDFARFLEISLGSSFEVETQLIIAKNLLYISEVQQSALIINLLSIEKRLNHFIKKLREH